MAGAFVRGPADGFMSKGQSNHVRERIEGHELRLPGTAFREHVLVDIVAGVVAHVHRTATALDAVPRREIPHGEMVLWVGDVP